MSSALPLRMALATALCSSPQTARCKQVQQGGGRGLQACKEWATRRWACGGMGG